MELSTMVIFAAGIANAVYSDEFPAPDILAGMFRIDGTNATGTLTVVYQHSADGVNWIDKATIVSGVAITVNVANNLFASDTGATPALPRGRFQCYTATTASCRIRAYVSGRAY